MTVDIRPVTSDRWGDLVELFERKGPRGGTPVTANCWCMWWRERTGDRRRNKQAMGKLVRGERIPGLLAYEEGVPVGWVSVGPRENFGQLVRSRTYRPVDEDADVWSIVCFYLHATAKRRGVAAALAEAAVAHAFENGAQAVEAYVSEPPDYMGARGHLDDLGFEAVRTAGKRTVMRRWRP